MRPYARILLVLALCQPACGDNKGRASADAAPLTPTPDAAAQSDPDGPQFLQFDVSPDRISQGQQAVFTAVLTDPDGIEDLVGGTLETADGETLLPFQAAGAPGAYSAALTWDAVHTAVGLEFTTEEELSLVARFFDRDGHASTVTVTLGFHCDGLAACGGACVDLARDGDHCGACGHGCAGGGCQKALCTPVRLPGNRPTAGTLAHGGDDVYFTTATSDGIYRVDETGGAASRVHPLGIAPDELLYHEGRLYWLLHQKTTDAGGALGGYDLATKTVILDVDNLGYPRELRATAASLVTSGVIEGESRVRFTSIVGGQLSYLGATSETLGGIAIDGDAVLWSTRSAVYRAPTATGVPTGIAAFTPALSSQGLGPALVVDGDYYVHTSGAILRVPAGGGDPEEVTSTDDLVQGFAVTDHGLYWADASGTIGRIDRAAGSVAIVGDGLENLGSIAASGDRVYVIASGDILQIVD